MGSFLKVYESFFQGPEAYASFQATLEKDKRQAAYIAKMGERGYAGAKALIGMATGATTAAAQKEAAAKLAKHLTPEELKQNIQMLKNQINGDYPASSSSSKRRRIRSSKRDDDSDSDSSSPSNSSHDSKSSEEDKDAKRRRSVPRRDDRKPEKQKAKETKRSGKKNKADSKYSTSSEDETESNGSEESSCNTSDGDDSDREEKKRRRSKQRAESRQSGKHSSDKERRLAKDSTKKAHAKNEMRSQDGDQQVFPEVEVSTPISFGFETQLSTTSPPSTSSHAVPLVELPVQKDNRRASSLKQSDDEDDDDAVSKARHKSRKEATSKDKSSSSSKRHHSKRKSDHKSAAGVSLLSSRNQKNRRGEILSSGEENSDDDEQDNDGDNEEDQSEGDDDRIVQEKTAIVPPIVKDSRNGRGDSKKHSSSATSAFSSKRSNDNRKKENSSAASSSSSWWIKRAALWQGHHISQGPRALFFWMIISIDIVLVLLFLWFIAGFISLTQIGFQSAATVGSAGMSIFSGTSSAFFWASNGVKSAFNSASNGGAGGWLYSKGIDPSQYNQPYSSIQQEQQQQQHGQLQQQQNNNQQIRTGGNTESNFLKPSSSSSYISSSYQAVEEKPVIEDASYVAGLRNAWTTWWYSALQSEDGSAGRAQQVPIPAGSQTNVKIETNTNQPYYVNPMALKVPTFGDLNQFAATANAKNEASSSSSTPPVLPTIISSSQPLVPSPVVEKAKSIRTFEIIEDDLVVADISDTANLQPNIPQPPSSSSTSHFAEQTNIVVETNPDGSNSDLTTSSTTISRQTTNVPAKQTVTLHPPPPAPTDVKSLINYLSAMYSDGRLEIASIVPSPSSDRENGGGNNGILFVMTESHPVPFDKDAATFESGVLHFTIFAPTSYHSYKYESRGEAIVHYKNWFSMMENKTVSAS